MSSSGGVIISGVYFGDVTTYPFRVGDSTQSGEAARILISHIQGNKQSVTGLQKTCFEQSLIDISAMCDRRRCGQYSLSRAGSITPLTAPRLHEHHIILQ